MKEVWWIIGKCATIKLRNQYTNENMLFVICIFDEEEALKKSLIYPLMVLYLDPANN